MGRKFYTTEDKVDAFESFIEIFTKLFAELKDLGKKKPEAVLSTSKVKIINRILVDIKECLENEPDAKYLDLLDDDTLPQYGDAILIMAQFEGALEAFKERHYGYQSSIGSSAWYLRDEPQQNDEGEPSDDNGL